VAVMSIHYYACTIYLDEFYISKDRHPPHTQKKPFSSSDIHHHVAHYDCGRCCLRAHVASFIVFVPHFLPSLPFLPSFSSFSSFPCFTSLPTFFLSQSTLATYGTLCEIPLRPFSELPTYDTSGFTCYHKCESIYLAI
jgi:hypothetical protein